MHMTLYRVHKSQHKSPKSWVYLGPGVKVGSLFWSAIIYITINQQVRAASTLKCLQ